MISEGSTNFLKQGSDVYSFDYDYYWSEHVLEHPYEIVLNDYNKRQDLNESSARTYPRQIPMTVLEAKGIYLKDLEGRIFIDCLAGAGSLPLGHNHPNISKKIKEVLNANHPVQTLDLITPIKDQFVQDLFSILPNEFAKDAKIQFCSPSGADGIEAAIKLVKTATGRKNIFSFQGGFHGMTHGALALTGNLSPKKKVASLMPNVVNLPFPYHYRCPFGIGGKKAEEISLHYIDQLLGDPESGIDKPAAFILECVQGEGGVIPASEFWLKGIREITKKHDIYLIVDEVQAGMGRTGKMFAFEHASITPDAIVISKGIGGGMPLSLLVYNEKLDKWGPGAHTGTFRGNQLSMASASVVINYLKTYDILRHVTELGTYFMHQLELMKMAFPFLGDVRGKGLMIGVEIVDPESEPNALGSQAPFKELAQRIQHECLRRGLIIELGGRHGTVIRFLPPLNIGKYEVDCICKILQKSFEIVQR